MPASFPVALPTDALPTNATIQAAVDAAAAAGGGVVHVPPAVYAMSDALHLRTGVRIVGAPGAVLRKVPSVTSRIEHFLGYGHYEFTVAEPEKFRVGMGVHILDDHAVGFYTTVATIVGREGDWFFLDRMFNHDYHVVHNARVISVHSLIEGYQVADAAAEGLTVDGNLTGELVWLNGCRGGGVFLLQCQRVVLDRLDVHDFRGDGLSFQQCTDITVRRCELHHQAGGGLHPGSGSVRYVLAGNRIHDNGGDGIFYCLRTTHSHCRDNVIERNGGVGISIGERDTNHLVTGNTVRENGGAAIAFRVPVKQSGDEVRVEGNALGPNCRKRDTHEVVIPAGLAGIHVAHNAIFPGKGGAISVAPGVARVSIVNNTIVDRLQQPTDIAGPPTAWSGVAPSELPTTAPAALPPSGARHLGLAQLAPWSEA